MDGRPHKLAKPLRTRGDLRTKDCAWQRESAACDVVRSHELIELPFAPAERLMGLGNVSDPEQHSAMDFAPVVPPRMTGRKTLQTLHHERPTGARGRKGGPWVTEHAGIAGVDEVPKEFCVARRRSKERDAIGVAQERLSQRAVGLGEVVHDQAEMNAITPK